MRHGEAENNVNRVLVGRHLESHLTEQGRSQVEHTAQYLKELSISKIYTSPVTRTVETAEIASNVLGLDYEIDERLYEIDLGKLAGTKYDEIVSKFGNLFLSFYNGDNSILSKLDVEPFESVKIRIKNLLDSLTTKFDNQNILMITHLDPIKAALSSVLDLKPEVLYNWHMENAALTILKHSYEQWSVATVNFMGAQRYL